MSDNSRKKLCLALTKSGDVCKNYAVKGANSCHLHMSETDNLLIEMEKLKKDSARLDWLERKCSGASDSERYIPFRIYWGGGSHGDIRRAIDEAMEAADE